ncbi:MAG: TIGR03618 family F420-dependent PPOX class oxidoreductase [Actinobacteria bacterium]|nr:TIGR03618 family F420-dependent PPOX class oxidoreductase [Actinomycetota bacterium]
MAHDRSGIALSDEEVDGLLRSSRTMVLVTIGPDGLPDPVPMWFVVDDGGAIWMRTYAKSQKVVNLERDPRFSALVEDGEHYTELRGAQLSGRVELVDDVDRICDIAAGLMVKYEGLAPEHVDAVREAYRPRAPKQRALRLHVDRVVSWDHGKQAGA